MRAVFCFLASLFVACYVYALWSDWFTSAELDWVGNRPVYSETLDLTKSGPIVWQVPKDQWIVKDGKADLSLSLNLATLREITEGPGELRVKVRAEGRRRGVDWQDRMIKDWYFTTDEPFSGNARLWSSYGLGHAEYGMAGMEILSEEELRITVDVLVPDGMLMTGRPRLKLIGHHDYAARLPRMLFHYVFREGGFWLSIFLIVVMGFMAWYRRPLPNVATKNPNAAEP